MKQASTSMAPIGLIMKLDIDKCKTLKFNDYTKISPISHSPSSPAIKAIAIASKHGNAQQVLGVTQWRVIACSGLMVVSVW